MFADAGGRIVISGNTNSTKAPGLDLQHEIQVMTDAGLTPMQIVQGTTKWPAEMIGKQDLLGTIDVGKLADVIILGRNPLEDTRHMQRDRDRDPGRPDHRARLSRRLHAIHS